MTDLNDLLPSGTGWTIKDARGINDAGQIVGIGRNPSGQTHAFVMSPDRRAVPPGLFPAKPFSGQVATVLRDEPPATMQTTFISNARQWNASRQMPMETPIRQVVQSEAKELFSPVSTVGHAQDAVFQDLLSGRLGLG
jgi:probable HAF family extracellular repeat protein